MLEKKLPYHVMHLRRDSIILGGDHYPFRIYFDIHWLGAVMLVE